MAHKQRDGKLLKILPYLSVLTFLLLWQMIVTLGIVPNTLLASPLQVIELFFDKWTNVNPDGALLGKHLWVSVQEAFTGYILALLIGVPLGLMIGWFKVAEGLLRPVFELVRPIPPVAWIPIAIFAFGIGLSSKVFIIFMSGFVPCVINSYTGVRMTNPTLIKMARTYGASEFKIWTSMCIPSALPMVFGGLQLSLAISWMTLVAAELVAADAGLGFLITMGRRLLMPDMIILGMFMVGLTGVAISVIVGLAEKRLVAWSRR